MNALNESKGLEGQGACALTCLLGGTRKRRKYRYDFGQELASVVRILDHCLENNVDEKTNNGFYDDAFDV